MEGDSGMTPEMGAVQIARVLTGNQAFDWDWEKGKIVEEKEVVEINTKEREPSKVCKGCGQEKPLDEYYRDKSYADGHKSRCKACSAKGVGVVSKADKINAGEWRCADCGLIVPLGEAHKHFGKSSDTWSGLAYRCRPCKRKKQRVYRAQRAGIPKAGVDISLRADHTPAGGKITLDLTHRPEILEWITRQAQSEERSIVGQITWELKQIMEAHV